MHKFHLTLDTSRGDTSIFKRYMKEKNLVDHFEDALSHDMDSGEENIVAVVRNKNKFFAYLNRKSPIDFTDPRDLILNWVYLGQQAKNRTPKNAKKLIKKMQSKIPF